MVSSQFTTVITTTFKLSNSTNTQRHKLQTELKMIEAFCAFGIVIFSSLVFLFVIKCKKLDVQTICSEEAHTSLRSNTDRYFDQEFVSSGSVGYCGDVPLIRVSLSSPAWYESAASDPNELSSTSQSTSSSSRSSSSQLSSSRLSSSQLSSRDARRYLKNCEVAHRYPSSWSSAFQPARTSLSNPSSRVCNPEPNPTLKSL